MKKVLLTTCNAKYIHKNLALRWLYTTCPHRERVTIREYTIKEREEQIASDILSMEVDVVCFSCYIWNIQQIKTIIQLLKQHDPLLHIVVGGPEVSYESYRLRGRHQYRRRGTEHLGIHHHAGRGAAS